MVNHKCGINGDPDDKNYASPMLVIGLYIAASSLLCMLLMFSGTIIGFRACKRWLPCKFFTLNSVTLTLLSIAAKLTSMPSPSDQFSKLSGTTLICISMCFLMPSLGINPESETFTDMAALTIFVVTVAVNICMQMSTGVIVLFFAEHIVILCFLFILLVMMWHAYLHLSNTKKICSEDNKQVFRKGDGSVLQRLKVSYLFGYSSNPQLVACLCYMGVVSGVICPMCSTVLIQAAFRSLLLKQLKFCPGISVYKWSMSLIVVTQILTVCVGSFGVTFRWLALFKHMDFVSPDFFELHDVIRKNPILGIASRLDKFRMLFQKHCQLILVLLHDLIVLPVTVSRLYFDYVDEKFTISAIWVARKSEEDMEIWINQSKSEPLNPLFQLLSRTYPSHHPQVHPMEVRDPSRPDQKGIEVSSLSIALLVRIAQVSLPENHSKSLVQTFSEFNKVFRYIEKRINPKSLNNDNKLLFARAVWAGKEFNCLFPEFFSTPQYHPLPLPQPLSLGLKIIRKLKTKLSSDPVWDQLGIIVDFIERKRYSTLEELVVFVEQLFVDMVCVMLAQLPIAIFKSLNDSTDEDYEETVKHALKLVCKVQSVAEQVHWSFPAGSNFTCLISTGAAATQPDEIENDVYYDAVADQDDVIIEIE